MPKHLVVVESPAKANTINKYLGPDYHVMASYGHIRDLPPKDGSVDPTNDFAMQWQLDARAGKVVKEMIAHLKQADSLILATDPDREGEAISWHIEQTLREKKALKPNTPVQRVVFNEITKTAVQHAMANPRTVDAPLVDAYLARRALDYLVGFTLSPVLWRKLPGSRSAGRVQSVALKVICERELAIERFVPEEYWSLHAWLKLTGGKTGSVLAQLHQWQGNKLGKMSLNNGTQAHAAQADVEAGTPYTVTSVERKEVARHPSPPFITSTLQQEASRKLGFSVTRTMQTAQKLYEGVPLGGETVGLITYMRTDGVNLSAEAVTGLRAYIGQAMGNQYVPASPRLYKSKSKNAQEAHEAIRPTNVNRTPQRVKPYLNEDQYRLYELIWKRTVACQMASAKLEQLTVLLQAQSPPANAVLKATGSTVLFDGFLKLYQESMDETPALAAGDDGSEGDEGRLLPPLAQGDTLTLTQAKAEQHFTKPLPRFTEASLVKEMEALGIGRPSTYASIIRILQERNYVKMEQRRFIPEERGRLVTAFLTSFFATYVQSDFTSKLEDKLDDVSDNKLSYKALLNEFWHPFIKAIEATHELRLTEVIDALDEQLADYLFPLKAGQDETTTLEERRVCPACHTGRLSLKLGRFGSFLGCSEYPTCKYTKPLGGQDEDGANDGDDAARQLAEGAKQLGICPETQKAVTLNKGPYGYYVQLGEEEEIPPTGRAKKPKKVKPKRASLTAELKPATLTLEQALHLLALPRPLGLDATTGEMMSAGQGKFGPYVQVGNTFVSLKGDDSPYTITLDRATEVVNTSGKRPHTLGEFNGKPVALQKARFGYVLLYNRVKYALPKGSTPDTYTLDHAVVKLEQEAEKAKAAKASKAKPAPKTTKAKASPRKAAKPKA
jgi:DNA topoisomerase-1